MPPMLLLKGDKQFYGEINPAGSGNPEKLKKPAPPPDLSNVPLTNEVQRENRLTENIKDPYSREERESALEDKVVNVEKNKGEEDLGSRFVKFLQTPLVDVDEVSTKNQKQRELSRIGVAPEPVSNEVRPVGEIPMELGNRVMNFIEKELLKVVLLAGGLYLAGQFVQGIGQNVGKKNKVSSD